MNNSVDRLDRLIDTHCHLDFEAFDTDRPEVIARAAAAGVTRLIIPAINAESGAAALHLAATYPGIYVGVGIHPNDTKDYDPALLVSIGEQAREAKCCAIGEIGLDYYRDWSPKADQRRAFEDHLMLAAAVGKPVIIHNREAAEDVIAILRAWIGGLDGDLRARPGVLHSFSASWEIAEQALDLGFYLGFTGPVTFKNAEDTRRIAAAAPLERILVETDAPYLTPHPHRGQRNEPRYVRLVAERLAALRNMSDADFFALTTGNAERLFQLPIVARAEDVTVNAPDH
ncbi:MAG TPA: TatD family hydrolase [Aggregatilineales bacterium]|nr:TatD family hydrolase [Aggregatilineales bacterium]